MGFDIQQRPIPSAGAIHPIHTLICFNDVGWGRYNPVTHTLDILNLEEEWAHTFRDACDALCKVGAGCLVLFVAEPGLTASKYKNYESLVWRDAGILQGSLAIIAVGVGCNFCLLGITGNHWAKMLSNQCELTGVGAAILGA